MHPLTFIQDIVFSLRLMRKRPGMTLLVIAALVLGIGLNSGIFSVLNAVLLRPLPLFQPERLVWLMGKVNPAGNPIGVSYPDYLDWKSQNRCFEAMTAMYNLSFTLTGSGAPEHVSAAGLSASGLKTLGVSTILGRDFTEADDQRDGNRVVILNYPFWQRKFGGDSNILGKTLVLDDHPYTITGVLQPTPVGFLRRPDIYVANGPLVDAHIMERDTRYFFPIARLKLQFTVEQAQAEMDTIARRLAAQYPEADKNIGVTVFGMADQFTADGRKPLLLLIVASSLIFLLAAVNVMTVFIGNVIGRGQELSVRLAIGATRWSLLRQLFIQALVFGVIGGAFGLLLAKAGLAFFLQRFPTAFVRFQETTIDLRVVLVTIGMSLLASIIATLLPALYVFHLSPGSHLTGRWSSFAPAKYRVLGRGALILFEVSLASALSLVSGLLIKSFYQVEKVDLGFSPSHIFSFQINPPITRYGAPEQRTALFKAALAKLSSLPGLESVSGISSLPLTSQGWVNTLEVDGQSPIFGQQLMVEDESILPGFFQTMTLPILQGRDFNEADHDGTPPVIIVDDLLAAKLWPNQNPLGKRVRMSRFRGGPFRWLEVVGVVREIKHFGPERNTRWMQAYVPQYQDPSPALSFVINTTLSEATVRAETDQAIHEVDQGLPSENFETMDTYLATFLSSRKVNVLLLSGLAGIGIVLGAIGIYGVVAHSVIQRRREIAIRMAMGATPSETMFLVSRAGLLATAGGVLIGSVVVMCFKRVLASMLFGITALDPGIYLLSAFSMILLAVTASMIPASRLLRFNIQEILRQ